MDFKENPSIIYVYLCARNLLEYKIYNVWNDDKYWIEHKSYRRYFKRYGRGTKDTWTSLYGKYLRSTGTRYKR